LLGESGKPVSDARITFVSPEVDNDTQTILAKASIENPKGQLRVSQQMRAQVVWSNHQGPVVPVLAVTRISGRFFVFLAVKDGAGTVARQKGLTIGDTVGNDYVVLDGLKPGDHLIVSGTQFLQDGMPVVEQIQNATAEPAADKPEKGAGR
jgi:multidrug efflux pump subunit AcrA (membrane-fusion protein)